MPEGASLSTYAFRRGTLTALYFNDNAGPDVARRLANHIPGDGVLERHYIDFRQIEHLLGTVVEPADGPRAVYTSIFLAASVSPSEQTWLPENA